MTPIQSIQPFIDLELHTIPLNGKHIKRDSKGKKHGFSMPSNWQEQYSKHLNELATPLGGLITGKDGLVAIDCDDKKTYDLFRQLDSANTAYFNSIGKLDKKGNLLECGTILYKHDDSLPISFRTNNGYDLDYYNGSGFVFLPTVHNETKTVWLENDNKLYNQDGLEVIFHSMPSTVKDLLELLHVRPEPAKTIATTTTSLSSRGFLAKALVGVDFKEYNPLVTKILTPKEYRSAKYVKQGHLHPNDIQGSGHMYLFKIACILAGDNTVDKDLFRDIMDYLNQLWDEPMSDKLLEKTIIAPIISGRSINQTTGDPYWTYDENWETVAGWSVIDKMDGYLWDIFYDPFKSQYFLYNTITERIEQRDDESRLIKHIRASTIGKFNQAEVIQEMNNLLTIVEPSQDFGYLNDDMNFNLFKPTESLKVLHDPEAYADSYKIPTEFIDYMEHFIPSEQQRNYLLSLIRTKLTTFNYSPVVPYIIGVQGSGKNTLISVIANMLGHQYVVPDVTGSQFIEKYNDWMVDKYVVHLNEMAETLPTAKERKEAQGKLKTYTGSTIMQVRAMRTGYVQTEMRAMFIMTANSSPLTIEDKDRRLYYISTPNVFDFSPQCQASSPTAIYNAIMRQTKDIAYYLATEIENLSDMDYIRAPEHEGKNSMIFLSLNTSNKIGWALANGEFDLLVDFLINPDPLFEDKESGRVTLASLVKVYEEQSKTDDAEHTMSTIMKQVGLDQKRGSANAKYYIIDGLADYNYKMPISDDEAETIPLEEVRT